jgi:hypothetical protein
MKLKNTARAAAIAAGVGISTMVFGLGPVTAAPLDPPPSPNQPIPGGQHVPATEPTKGADAHNGVASGGSHGAGGVTQPSKTP